MIGRNVAVSFVPAIVSVTVVALAFLMLLDAEVLETDVDLVDEELLAARIQLQPLSIQRDC